jgi:hypothetical protein
MMARVLVLAAFVWPLVLGAAVWGGHGPAQSWTASVYMAASRICHQRPDRSFFTAGVQWPVCGRCSGLYLAAPVGAVLAVAGHRRRSTPQTARTLVAAAALPTIATLGLEWLQLTAISNLARAAAAAPLGAAIAWVLVRVAEPRVH